MGEPTTSSNFDQVLEDLEALLESDPENTSLLEYHLAMSLGARIATIHEIRLRRDANRLLELDSLNTTALSVLSFLDIREWIRVRNGVNYKDYVVPPRDPFNLDEVEQKGGTIFDVHTESGKLLAESIGRLQMALDQDPRNPFAAALLAVVCIADKESDCLDDLIHALQLYQATNPLTDLLAGYRANANRQYAEAENHFMRAFAFLPNYMVEAYSNPELILLPDKELTEDGLPNFWSSKDVRLLTEANERWTEHVSRAVYADLVFTDWEVPLSGINSERGNIWMRYGQPERDVNLFRLLEVGSETVRVGSAFHILEYAEARFVLEHPVSATSTEYRHYSPSADFYSAQMSLGAIRDYVIQARVQIKERPEVFDTNGPGHTRVEFPYQVSRFRSLKRDGSLDILVSMGVQVPYIPNRGNLSMGLKTGLFALDATGKRAGSLARDWSLLSRDALREIDELTLWTYADILSDVPAGGEVSVEFETTESGAVFGHHRMSTNDPPPVLVGFGISDLVLARLVLDADGSSKQSHSITRDGVTVYPASISLFSIQAPIYLYFETYEGEVVDGRSRYRVSAALVERKDDRPVRRILSALANRNRENSVLVSFDLDSEEPFRNHYFVLDASNQEAGDYWAVMEVTDLNSGETRETRRAVSLY
jgi:GWxTD domain-containing protein